MSWASYNVVEQLTCCQKLTTFPGHPHGRNATAFQQGAVACEKRIFHAPMTRFLQLNWFSCGSWWSSIQETLSRRPVGGRIKHTWATLPDILWIAKKYFSLFVQENNVFFGLAHLFLSEQGYWYTLFSLVTQCNKLKIEGRIMFVIQKSLSKSLGNNVNGNQMNWTKSTQVLTNLNSCGIYYVEREDLI